MFSLTYRGLSLHSRRRWEQRIASVLSETKEATVDACTKRFNRIYKERQFTPVEVAFPLLQRSRGASDAGPSTSPVKAEVEQPAHPRVLRATFLGPQNAGKSSLVNALALHQIATVSNRFGSTKDWTKAVATVHDTQLLLLDTPGIVVVRSEKDRRRHATGSARALDSMFVADLVVLTLPVGLGFVEPEHKRVVSEVMQRAAARELPVVLTFTMMDKVQTPRHRELYFSLRADMESMGLPFSSTKEVSVKGASGLVELKDSLCQFAKEGPWEHMRREATDLHVVDRVGEMLRQAYFDLLPHEIPHCMKQRIIGWTRKDSGTTEVVVEVFFERPSYMFTFYSKLEAICVYAQRTTEQELRSRYRFVFQAFVTPSGIAQR